MSRPIQSWTDGYLALRQRADELCGTTSADPDRPEATRWPNTTGADVIAIASIIDPVLRGVCAERGDAGLARRWRTEVDDLAAFAIASPGEPYRENRCFWATLAQVTIYLDSVVATAPSEAVWNALVAGLGRREATDLVRNTGPSGDGPFAHFDAKTYDDLWNAQRHYLAERRGSDALPAPGGFGGGTMPIPRTTNLDVLQLATYWTNELAKAPHASNYDATTAMWHRVLGDVDRYAKPGKPDEVYAKNNELWRAMLAVAVQVAIGDESPSRWSMLVDSVKHGVSQLPETLGHTASDAAHALGKIVHEAGKGLVAGLGVPLLIGVGVIGWLLLARPRREHAE